MFKWKYRYTLQNMGLIHTVCRMQINPIIISTALLSLSLPLSLLLLFWLKSLSIIREMKINFIMGDAPFHKLTYIWRNMKSGLKKWFTQCYPAYCLRALFCVYVSKAKNFSTVRICKHLFLYCLLLFVFSICFN